MNILSTILLNLHYFILYLAWQHLVVSYDHISLYSSRSMQKGYTTALKLFEKKAKKEKQRQKKAKMKIILVPSLHAP